MTPPHIPPALIRLRVKPDEPAEGPPAIDGHRPPGLRRMHSDLTIARVRHLVETTGLSYREIGEKVGIPHSNITGWKRDHGWQRPPHAPRHKDMIPTARAGRRLKLRRLAERLVVASEIAVTHKHNHFPPSPVAILPASPSSTRAGSASIAAASISTTR